MSFMYQRKKKKRINTFISKLMWSSQHWDHCSASHDLGQTLFFSLGASSIYPPNYYSSFCVYQDFLSESKGITSRGIINIDTDKVSLALRS